MKFKTVVEREGELLGPVDWAYDFRSHFSNYCCSDERKAEYCARAVALLRRAVEMMEASASSEVEVRIHDYWKSLITIGMYDGWPYWKPTPALLVRGVLGSEWQFFYELTGVRARGERS